MSHSLGETNCCSLYFLSSLPSQYNNKYNNFNIRIFWGFFFFKSPTADAISKVSGEQQSQSFNNAFMPHGRPLSAGSYVRLPRLAGVLEAGLLNFYHGNLSQEIVDEVTDIHIQTGMTL